jgi:hypothetical protein
LGVFSFTALFFLGMRRATDPSHVIEVSAD